MGKGGNTSNQQAPALAPHDFYWETTDEPHATRRKLISEKYPQIKSLFGHCPRTKYQVLAAVSTQCFLAYYTQDKSWAVFFTIAYVIGDVKSHDDVSNARISS